MQTCSKIAKCQSATGRYGVRLPSPHVFRCLRTNLSVIFSPQPQPTPTPQPPTPNPLNSPFSAMDATKSRVEELLVLLLVDVDDDVEMDVELLVLVLELVEVLLEVEVEVEVAVVSTMRSHTKRRSELHVSSSHLPSSSPLSPRALRMRQSSRRRLDGSPARYG